MRRYTILLLLALGLFLISVVVWAQDYPLGVATQSNPIIVTNPPEQMLAGPSEWQPITVTPVDTSQTPSSPSAGAANDSCSAATFLSVSETGDGGTTSVNSMGEDLTDPSLSCAWGAPSAGYRTVWYQFTAPYNGHARISTFGSNYDTIMAIHAGSCGSLTTVVCSDDSNGFTSEATITVRKGETYYVEVADWEFSAPTEKTLNISALMAPINSLWTLEGLRPSGGLSRHATAVNGNDIYVIGGQTNLSAIPEISNQIQRFETDTGLWSTLQSMPGAGYSNTTAVYVDGLDDNGRIYLPSGYTGGSAYDMTHWAYDIQGGYWLTRTAVTEGVPPTTPNFAWATAVAVTSPKPGYYLTGGLNTIGDPASVNDVRSEILFFDPVANATFPTGLWQSKSAMSVSRYAHTAALVNGRICVVGGLRHDGNNIILLASGECYDQSAGSWATIGSLNYGRYAAGSAVGPDGKWYVFGGVDGNNTAVSETEVYDPTTNTWTVLDVNHDLGGSQSQLARAWPRGGVVDSALWVIGGNDMTGSQNALSLVESIFLPTHQHLLPVVFSDYGDNNRPDDHFGVARPLALNVADFRNFDNRNDYYDVYTFELSALPAVTINLTQVPADSNYDIAIYDASKQIQGKGDRLQGLDESVPLTLLAGRYYIVVERVWPGGDPNTANYRLIVQK